MNTLVRGGVAGAIATGTMSAVIAGAKLGGLVHLPPPKQIAHRAGKKLGFDISKLPEPAFRTLWLGAHLGYGITCGIGYALVVRRFLPGRPEIRGLLFGEALWAIGYLGFLPGLGLYPSPDDDSSSRTAVMIVAHAVYGVTAAITEAELDQSM